MPRATSTFTMDDTQSAPVEWEAGTMSRTRFVKTFSGEVSGTGVVEAVMLRTDGPAVYAGVERISGSVHGRAGSFLLLHAATMLGGDTVAAWTVVPGSGTGELSGLSGHGDISADHDFVLTYELGP